MRAPSRTVMHRNSIAAVLLYAAASLGFVLGYDCGRPANAAPILRSAAEAAHPAKAVRVARAVAKATRPLSGYVRRVVWRTMDVVATAYVVNKAESGKCTTNTDKTAWRSLPPARGTIAIDPRTFPYGTRFRVPGYGEGVATDSGKAIKRRIIDLAVDTCAEAFRWGRRPVTVAYAVP